MGSEAGVGPLLRQWRERRRMSQLELALAADSSTRHLSFVENGRSKPSQSMVLKLAEHLDVPVRDRNALLLAAGYAPLYSQLPLSSPEMTTVRVGIERLLDAYAPFPALVFDGTYEVVAANSAVQRIFLDGVSPAVTANGINLLRVGLHPDGLARRVVDFPAWREHLLERVERSLTARPSPTLQAVYDEVTAYPIVDGLPGTGPGPTVAVALPFQLAVDDRVLSFITTVATFNSPLDITVSELAIETFLPADQSTVDYLRD
ncbi:helix-turn-helix transcriptional regulator [Actinokineospora sp. NBRC 105648]|uniref:helix-turn-helix domain-containing protein n=1 Tax=Actinokineospora sp. NBRC 105648 TaxID=3032206 RepID=UPI0024A35E9D|nr:helix-turn-helix transcriptional regulator [Actinokineospora sp. NBRC 105648]GLZ39211.1 transcriptional regulator [Actinokineospora sp. NBRC 105648]